MITGLIFGIILYQLIKWIFPEKYKDIIILIVVPYLIYILIKANINQWNQLKELF
jgi:hypothetical protein